ncbi:DUF4190 domain-containing protein [Nocardiopsis sp. MG754419]|uniref:DUF4190 domain-containing protein n=1 Tax=Nocardiopsis sp. MG754419 TaxID=2259865 RepID=UPI001BADBFA5|nr:DUF4190 domain-containing protein [Nocardiopsis sp. MG754419]MBR8741264.1 DUF4190 domain-containing protein [Nocardiopsis sp. MG754419]
MTDNSPETHADDRPPKVERGGLWGLFLGLAGLLFPPYSGLLSALGVVQGLRARRAARAQGSTAPGALSSVVLGAVGVVISVAMVSVLLIYSDQVREYRDCAARAHTVSAQKVCDDAWESGTGLPTMVVGG